MTQYQEIEPVDVRAVLARTPLRTKLQSWEASKCYASF